MEELFESKLKDHETILWCGQPKRGIQLRDADLILIPMSLITIGFASVINFIAYSYGAAIVFKVIGMLIALAAIQMSVLRFFSDARKRHRMFYCVTSRRILMIRGRKKKFSTLPLKNIDRLELMEEKDGSGFIIFGTTNPLYPWLFGAFYFSGDAIPGMELLPDVKSVFKLIEDQIKIEISSSLLKKISAEDKTALN